MQQREGVQRNLPTLRQRTTQMLQTVMSDVDQTGEEEMNSAYRHGLEVLGQYNLRKEENQ